MCESSCKALGLCPSQRVIDYSGPWLVITLKCSHSIHDDHGKGCQVVEIKFNEFSTRDITWHFQYDALLRLLYINITLEKT